MVVVVGVVKFFVGSIIGRPVGISHALTTNSDSLEQRVRLEHHISTEREGPVDELSGVRLEESVQDSSSLVIVFAGGATIDRFIPTVIGASSRLIA